MMIVNLLSEQGKHKWDDFEKNSFVAALDTC